MPLCFSGGERDDGFLRKNNSGIPGIHPDSERSDRKRKNDVKITLFNNIYGMWYAKILQSSTDQPYTGNFTLYVLKLKE